MPDELRERYSKLSSAELLLIVRSPGRYTPEVQNAAASVLASRRFGINPPQPPEPPVDQETPSGAWPIFFAIGGYLVLHLHWILGPAQRAGLDADVMLRVARILVNNPWTYVVALTGCLFVLRQRRS